MRYSCITAAALSLVLGVAADVLPGPICIPADSACKFDSDTYPTPKLPEAEKHLVCQHGAGAVIAGGQRRSLGVSALPRRWARDILGSLGAAPPFLGCACVKPGRTSGFGYFHLGQCPVPRGVSHYMCSIPEDGYQCLFFAANEALAGQHFNDEKCDAEFPGTKAQCVPTYGAIV